MEKFLKLPRVPLFALQPVLQGIPFFRKVLSRDPEQIKFIVDNSVLQRVAPGEVVIRKGDFDNAIYFLLMGNLAVFPDNNSPYPVSHMAPGEMFGEVAMIQGLERTSTVRGDVNSRSILLIRTDFSPFGELTDMRRISLATKLVFYQAIVETIQSRLTQFSTVYPEFAVDHEENIPPQPKRTDDPQEMLVYYYRTGRSLARTLTGWNHQLGALYGHRGSPQAVGLKTILHMMSNDSKNAAPTAQPSARPAAQASSNPTSHPVTRPVAHPMGKPGAKPAAPGGLKPGDPFHGVQSMLDSLGQQPHPPKSQGLPSAEEPLEEFKPRVFHH
ncbi:MAG: cyclic nucleotide-binding domain-containing protein [Deltaproteobacteria bacterium]|nr:cyclic nucleotide-binding domain-containing protein [Deltaproteobacteria bacterium]